MSDKMLTKNQIEAIEEIFEATDDLEHFEDVESLESFDIASEQWDSLQDETEEAVENLVIDVAQEIGQQEEEEVEQIDEQEVEEIAQEEELPEANPPLPAGQICPLGYSTFSDIRVSGGKVKHITLRYKDGESNNAIQYTSLHLVETKAEGVAFQLILSYVRDGQLHPKRSKVYSFSREPEHVDASYSLPTSGSNWLDLTKVRNVVIYRSAKQIQFWKEDGKSQVYDLATMTDANGQLIEE